MKIQPLNKMTVNKGDTVYIAKPLRYGWGRIFRHMHYIKATVTRVTPKRNTIETDEFTIGKDNEIYGYSPEIDEANKLADAMEYIDKTIREIYDKDHDESLYRMIADNILMRLASQCYGTKLTIDTAAVLEKLPTFDFILIEKEGNKGLTPKELQELFTLMGEEQYYPFECDGVESEKSVYGFVSRRFAEYCQFDYKDVIPDITSILDHTVELNQGIFREKDCIYETDKYTMFLGKSVSELINAYRE